MRSDGFALADKVKVRPNHVSREVLRAECLRRPFLLKRFWSGILEITIMYEVQGTLNINTAILGSFQSLEYYWTNWHAYSNDIYVSQKRGAVPYMRQQLQKQLPTQTRTKKKCPRTEVAHLYVQVVSLHKLEIKPITKSLQVSNICK